MARADRENEASQGAPDRADWLARLGERVRAVRARRGMTRRLLSTHSGVSERFLAQLEAGQGNVSVGRLRDIAAAMNVPLSDLLDDDTQDADLRLLLADLYGLSTDQLQAVRHYVSEQILGGTERARRIALIGLRGAGKSTLGRALAAHLATPFVELQAEVMHAAGAEREEMFDLLGQGAYRRQERASLEHFIAGHEAAVLETGGSLVAEAATYARLLAGCHVIWLKAAPEEHMQRVIAQGDMRPMAGNRQAMADLKRILREREALYARAHAVVDTAGLSIDQAAGRLTAAAEDLLHR